MICVPTASTRHAVWASVLYHTDGLGSTDDTRDPAQHDHDSMGKFVTIIKNPLNVKFFVDYIQQQKRLRRQEKGLEHRDAVEVTYVEEMKVGR